jgi:hypothetical protein
MYAICKGSPLTPTASKLAEVPRDDSSRLIVSEQTLKDRACNDRKYTFDDVKLSSLTDELHRFMRDVISTRMLKVSLRGEASRGS